MQKIRILLAYTGLLVLTGCHINKPRQEKRPNVLFILVDQFRQDIAGVYGGTQISTPNIDRLAAAGVVFNHAVSTCPLCTPYRGMLMTGKYPTHTGIVVNFVNVTSDNYKKTLGETFANEGYNTGYIGKWHLGAGGWTNYGDEPRGKKGIDHENNYIPPGSGRLGFGYWAAYNFHTQFNNYWYYNDSPEEIYSGQYETDCQVSQAIDFMERQKEGEKPFFLVLSTHPPHPPFSKKYCPNGYYEQTPDTITWPGNVTEKHNRTEGQLRCYLAMCKNIDDNIGRLMEYLKTSGLSKKTIVVFTSDHGEMNGSHGLTSKQKPYAEAINIPLIYSYPPGIPAGTRHQTVFTPMDHFPTLCSLAGINLPDNIDGENIAPTLKDSIAGTRRSVLIGNYVSDYNIFSSSSRFPEWRGVYNGEYTYVKWLTGEEELYDNLKDPLQLKNLAFEPSSSGVLNHLKERLERLLTEAGDNFEPGYEYRKWYDEKRYPKMSLISSTGN